MANKTKIILLQAKELIYTGIFLALGIVLIIILVFMFQSSDKEKQTGEIYVPGVYSSSITLGGTALDVEVTVDADRVNSVSFVNIDESITTLYPLLTPALDSVNEQLQATGNIEDVIYSESYQYTGTILNQAIQNALETAKIKK